MLRSRAGGLFVAAILLVCVLPAGRLAAQPVSR